MNTTAGNRLALGDIEHGARIVLQGFGYSAGLAASLARRIFDAEHAGIASHGLGMLTRYEDCARSERVNLAPSPRALAARPGLMVLDCDNSFAAFGLDQERAAFIRMTRSQGIACVVTRNALHLNALGSDILPFSEAGLIVIAMSGTAPWVVPHGGIRPILGTNPIAFSCPRKDGPPILWDQASSIVSVSDVRLAQREGRKLHREAGLDAMGTPTVDPDAILASGTLLPFGEHKGTAIALMVELLTAGLSGGTFSFDFNAAKDGPLNQAGQLYIAIDPSTVSDGFLTHIEAFLHQFEDNGSARIPGDGRLSRQSKAQADGISVSPALYQKLVEWGWPR